MLNISHGPVFSSRRIALALIVAGGILAFVIWTLPNWGDFSLVLSQGSDLWQIPENRFLMLALTIRILSPLFLMTMIGIVVRICSLMRPEGAFQGRPHLREAVIGTASRHDPITPIPETVEPVEPPTPISSVDGGVTSPVISIRLLKEISIVITVPGGEPVTVKIADNVKKLEMLAYIARRQGLPVERDKLLEQVFGWRTKDEDATPDKLIDRFDTMKKLLRKEIRRTVEEINLLRSLLSSSQSKGDHPGG